MGLAYDFIGFNGIEHMFKEDSMRFNMIIYIYILWFELTGYDLIGFNMNQYYLSWFNGIYYGFKSHSIGTLMMHCHGVYHDVL